MKTIEILIKAPSGSKKERIQKDIIKSIHESHDVDSYIEIDHIGYEDGVPVAKIIFEVK